MTRLTFSELHISQGNTKGSLLKATRVAPREKDGTELFRAQIPIAVLVEEAVEDLHHVGVDVPADHPVGDLDELVAGHPLLLRIEEEHRPFEVSSAEENVVKGFETLKCDSFGFAIELISNHLDHLLLLLLAN